MPQVNGPEPTTLPPTGYSTRNCTYLSEACPVEFTIYGFLPNLGASWFFCIFFGIAFGFQFIQGLKWKNWTFMIALVWGCIAECIGTLGASPTFLPATLTIVPRLRRTHYATSQSLVLQCF